MNWYLELLRSAWNENSVQNLQYGLGTVVVICVIFALIATTIPYE